MATIIEDMDEPTIIRFPSFQKSGRPRPALFLAMGLADPPTQVEFGDETYRRVRIFKHDSWAATALYENDSRRIVVKFNRQQSILGFPMKWLGRALARRETKMLQRLSCIVNVPAACANVKVDGKVVTTATAHDYVPGKSLLATDQVDDDFFPRLSKLLGQLHEHDVAYVDLHKRDNILVDVDGAPHLIDFQISVHLPSVGPISYLLKILQRCDRYHLAKHLHHLRPDQCEEPIDRPVWIKAHRLIAVPFRQFRRWILVGIGVRRGRGMASSEYAPQERQRPARRDRFDVNDIDQASTPSSAVRSLRLVPTDSRTLSQPGLSQPAGPSSETKLRRAA